MGKHFKKEVKLQLITKALELNRQGLNSDEIAKELNISAATARRYVKNVTRAQPKQRRPYTKRIPQLVQIEAAPTNQDLKLKVVYELMRFLNEK